MNLVFSISQDWLKKDRLWHINSKDPPIRSEPGQLELVDFNVNEASRQTGAGIGLQLKSPSREKIEQAILLGFITSNNESEYAAILTEIELAATVSAYKLLIRSDSQLVAGQVNEEYEL